MEQNPQGNYDLEQRDIFAVLNQYFLLFFGLSCILCSVFIQEIFVMFRQFRLGISLAPAAGIILPVVLLTRRFSGGFAKQLRIRVPSAKVTFYVVLATLAMVVVVDYIYVLSLRFMPAPVDYVENLKLLKPDGVWSTIITFVGLCLVVPFAEETVFRGIIQRVFARNMNNVAALVLAGVFFGVVHLNPQLLLSMASFGVFLGFIFLVTSNLTYTILGHGILNIVAFLQLTFATNENFETEPFYLQEYWMLVPTVAILVLLLARIKREAPAFDAEAPYQTDV